MNNFDIRKFINDLKEVNYEVDDNVLYYSCIYDCMTNPQGIEQYRRLKEISLKNREMLTHDELSDRYTFLLNFIIKNLKDDEAYSRERFEIDKELFDLPYLINIRNFKNLMKSGYDLEEYDTVEKLIVENVNLLPLEFREQTISILYASLNYKKRCFEKALEYLKKVNFTWVPFNLDGKVLEAKIYYEQDQVELLFLLIDSFRHYLNNRKEIVARDSVFRKEHFNFLKYIEKLAKIKLDPEKTGLHKFRNEISNETMFTSKGWLTKKAEELA
jgi:hypothetical protein